MNKYRITKNVYGDSMQDVLDIEKGGEIIYIELQEENHDKQIGFNKKCEDGERN